MNRCRFSLQIGVRLMALSSIHARTSFDAPLTYCDASLNLPYSTMGQCLSVLNAVRKIQWSHPRASAGGSAKM